MHQHAAAVGASSPVPHTGEDEVVPDGQRVFVLIWVIGCVGALENSHRPAPHTTRAMLRWDNLIVGVEHYVLAHLCRRPEVRAGLARSIQRHVLYRWFLLVGSLGVAEPCLRRRTKLCKAIKQNNTSSTSPVAMAAWMAALVALTVPALRAASERAASSAHRDRCR